MNAVEDLEAVFTPDPAEGLADSNPTPVVERSLSTQQLLDELLGRFDDDGSMMCVHDLGLESPANSNP